MSEATSGQAGKQPGETSTPVDALTAAADTVSASLREWADAMKSSYGKALDGKYTTKDLAGDIAGTFALTVRSWARAVTATAQVASSLAPRPTKPPPSTERGA
jgi:hypothetical protein